jgi:hypothetical protein
LIMLYRSILVVFVGLIVATATFAQDSSAPSPSPKPAAKRRTFDQFDLSDGVRVGGRSISDSTLSGPAVVETVDAQMYDGIKRMVEYASRIEQEYRDSAGVDPSDFFAPDRVLERKLPALYRIAEMFRVGLLDQPTLKNPANTKLISDVQMTISEAMPVVGLAAEKFPDAEKNLAPFVERYGVQLSYSGSVNEKRALLSAMIARINGDMSRLMNQVAVKK